jgi:hypothetical protein
LRLDKCGLVRQGYGLEKAEVGFWIKKRLAVSNRRLISKIQFLHPRHTLSNHYSLDFIKRNLNVPAIIKVGCAG